MKIKTMPLNPIQVNTYLVWDPVSLSAVIIDPACSTPVEDHRLLDFIADNQLKIEHILLTHPHFDHVVGAAVMCNHFNLPLTLHTKSQALLETSQTTAAMLGMSFRGLPSAYHWLEDGEQILVGGNPIEVAYTPGHADGSVCFILRADKVVFTGDVLFRQSIGRTDLMTGDYDLLKQSIDDKLFTLPEDFEVRPGHGGRTTIGYEKDHNPFFI